MVAAEWNSMSTTDKWANGTGTVLQTAGMIAGAGISGPATTPELPIFNGETTLGVLQTNEGATVPLSSGSPLLPNYAASGHVEGQAALYIREAESTGGTVYHNNTNGTCGYCNAQIPTLLPENSQLTVVPPANAVANNSRAVATPTTYTGNANAPKTPQ
jgi:hypothetical protein